jgi:mono/diheme cytochrome c family protein
VIRASILQLTFATLCAGVLALPAAAQTNGTGEKPVAGAFTEEQVSRGDTLYRALCSSCHVPSDHTGEQFKMNWFGRSVFDYFISLKKTMPDDNPGGLSDLEYTRVTAYILSLNGYPAGADSLSSDSTSMKLIKIGPPPGDTTKPPGTRR